MHKNIGIVVLLASLASGCGGSPQAGLPESVHQGNLIEIPGDKGFVEVQVDSGAGGRGEKKSSAKPRVTAFFYQKDAKTEMSPGPTDVSVKIGVGDKSPMMKLTAPAKGDGKYVSEPGTFPDGFRGELNATIAGESVQVPFTIR